MTQIKNRTSRPSTDAITAVMQSSALNALKWPIVINGGASIAMIGFVGTQDVGVSGGAVWAMRLFVLGVFSGALASCFAYLSNGATAITHDVDKFDHPEKAYEVISEWATRFVVICFSLVGISHLLFLLGGLFASCSL